ncbi:MAG: molybdopterin-dependent oxidoreductase, partial [Pseudomonadota bacterium]
DTRGREVMRVMPRVNEDVNEEWISDKTRFIWDGLRTQRLDRPFVKGADGKLKPASWSEAFHAVKSALDGKSGEKIGAVAGDLAGVEEMFALKQLMAKLGSTNTDCRQDGSKLDPTLGRASYIFNPSINGIEDADAIVIVGANPRFEASVLNARIRKAWRANPLPIAAIGEELGDLRYYYDYLGAGPETLAELVDGKGKFASTLKKAKRPMILVGQGALARGDGAGVLANAAKLAETVGALSDDWNGFAVLHTAAARVGGLDIGFVPGEGGKDAAAMVTEADVLFLLGADELPLDKRKSGATTIYIGTHGDVGAHHSDIILPASAYTEKSATYVNTEGRVQVTSRAGFAPGDAKEDWAILRALSDVIGQKLPYDSLPQLRAAMYAEVPHLAAIDEIAPGDTGDIKALAKKSGKMNKSAFRSPVRDFYLTNPVARASKVMAECSQLARDRKLPQAAE